MNELIFYIIILGGSLIITNEWAKSGWTGLWIPNFHQSLSLMAMFVGSIFGAIGGLMNKQGLVHLSLLEKGNFWPTVIIFVGVPLAYLFIKRHLIMPSGEFAYNRAIIRTKYWSKTHYIPDQGLPDESQKLRNLPLAQKTIELFLTAINALERRQAKLITTKSSNFNSLESLVKAQEELALLYRMMHHFPEAQDTLSKAYKTAELLVSNNRGSRDLLVLKNLILFSQAETYHVEGIEIRKAIALYLRCLPLAYAVGSNRDAKMIEKFINELNKKI